MASALTDHVRHFSTADDPADRVLPEVERLLKRKMRERNLYSATPEKLGYAGVPHWSAPGAFEDIVADCYIFAILQRRVALQNQLLVKPNVDGLIARNVGNFLTERQKRYDPIGYAVFGTVAGAAKELAAARELALDADAKVANDTVFRFDPADERPATVEVVTAALDADPDFAGTMEALTKTTAEGRAWACGFLRRVRACGEVAVRCGDVVTVVGGRVRAEWLARHAVPSAELAREGEDDFAAVVRVVRGDGAADARDHWARVKLTVPARIAELDRQERVRERLQIVFAALVGLVEDDAADPPTQATIADRAGVPRATLSDDFRLLRAVLDEVGEKYG